LRDGRAGVEVSIAGSIRRCVETIGDVNLVAASERPDVLLEAFVGHPAVATVTARGAERAAVRLGNGVAATLTVAARAAFGAALVQATGSATHVAALAERARDRGLDVARLRAGDEEAVYRALGLPPIPPELREGRGEIESAAAGDAFTDLVTLADLRGVVHCHSVYSDGRATIRDMAEAAAGLGLSYLTVTDHSPAASYAGGLSSDRLRAQAEEITAIQPSVAVRMLRGAECDILQDGSLDHEDALRGALEVVIASIHERHGMDGAAMTARLERALGAPRFKIWGHPLGRLLLRRPPIACDLDRVLDVVAASPAAIEVNGSPARLDLPSELIPGARARGIKFVISADAHSVAELDNLRTGVEVARRGGLRRDDVLNTLPADDFARAVAVGRSLS
jgi:DNA polymerase (family 10)